MTLSVVNLIMAIVVLVILPVIMGGEICYMLNIKRTAPYCFTFGMIGQWAICQIISVPLILLRQSFIVVVIVQSVIMLALCIKGIYQKHILEWKLEKHSIVEIVGLIAAITMTIAVLVPTISLQLTNADDARFVVNAVDIVRTNRLLLTDANTGKELTTWIGDLHKDIASPWPVYVAYLSKVTGVHVATMFHTILPPVLLLMMVSIYWMLAEEFFKKDRLSSYVFVVIAILVNVYGGYSIYSVGTFALTRLWQGKSVIAAIGVPVLLLSMLWLYRDIPQNKSWLKKNRDNTEEKVSHARDYIIILLIIFALCLPSNMGFILTTIVLGCFGLIYGIAKKSVGVALGMWLCCLPNLVYLLISYGFKP